jgi:pyrroloquinoline-quinone synthase
MTSSRTDPKVPRGPTEPALIMDRLLGAPTLDAAVAQVSAEYDFERHPYLLWMQAPDTTRDAFRATQVPFRFAVESFAQALAAVLARIPALEDRLAIADNVAEEHGRGSAIHSHKATFLQYLRALGLQDGELHVPCPVGVRAFGHALLAFCLAQGAEPGAAATGIIEHLYVGISADIAATVRDRAWCPPGSQRHYDVHEVLDEVHAQDLLEVARPAWHERSGRRQVALGLALGAHWFWALYRDLYALRG